MEKNEGMISVIAPVYCPEKCFLDMTEKLFLDSISKCTIKDRLKVIIVDNASPKSYELQELVKRVREEKKLDIKILRNERQLTYGGSFQRGVDNSESRYLLMTNNDIYAPSDSISRLFNVIYNNKHIGAIGPVTNFACGYSAQQLDKAIQINEFSETEYQKLASIAQIVATDNSGHFLKVNWLVGFFMLLRRNVYNRVGGFDNKLILGYHEESDLLARVRKERYDLVVDKSTFVFHGNIGPRKFFGPTLKYMKGQALKSFVINTVHFASNNGIKETVSLYYDYGVRRTFHPYPHKLKG